MRTSRAALAVLACSGLARADVLPWIAPGDVALPAGVKSARIIYRDEPLYTRPDPGSPRRGAAALGAYLPIYAAERGPGCPGRWLSVGALAWVCESRVELSMAPPLPANLDLRPAPDGLPYRYYFVGPDGALGYTRLDSAEEGAPDAELQPGFALAVRRVANKPSGDPFALTTHGLWIPMRDLGPARPESFQGATLDGSLDRVAWVFTDKAPVYDKPGGRRVKDEELLKFDALAVSETTTVHKHRWFRIGDRRWVDDRHARAPTPSDPPAGLRRGERWIDVDIENQVLVAYEGTRPVFATIVSTGKGAAKSERATPVGEHRIWVKLASTDMDNLENEEASRYYAIEDVPWVMFFEKGYGLHGTFWHHSFGSKRSHGCVNLTPLDAERLFYWTGPRLPAGWSAALPTPYDPGTLVRVR
jgi:hypothetical protein